MICGAVSTALCKKSFAQAPAFHDDHGTFVIALNGERVGTEKFEIRARDAQVEVRAETSLTVNGTRFETSSDLTLNASLNPLTYHWGQTTPQKSSLQIDFGPGGVRARYNTVRGRRDTRQFDLPPNSIILDDNAVHQYEIAAMRYDRTSGGTQTFHALIPQEGLPGMITLASAGTEAILIGNKQESCRHLILTTDLARVDLWVDAEEHLQKMEIAASGLIATRER
ncbi:MAG TPA: hypothetical protein VGX94_14800 [Terriglobia bacterium]|nr:hypothetical protein [Terriglobia bacterium]